MAIPTILQGDDSGGVTIALAEGHNYEGATLVVVFNGVTREFTNLTAGGEVSLAFTADETAGMPLGTGFVLMRLIGPTGAVETVGNADARIKVTDCVAEVNAGGSFAVTPGGNPLDGVEGLGTRYTGDQLRAKINEVIAKLGGTVAALLLCALPCLGGVTVQTAPLGVIYNDAPVVTNVTVDVSDKADATNVYTRAEVDERIVELAPAPGDYANVSNRAMTAIQEHQTLWPAVAASTNYADLAVGALETQLALGYKSVKSAEYADGAYDARRLYDELAFIAYNATDLIVASTNAAEAVVREKSLGGIWDQELGVWWTPVMQNGALRYETNAVQNAADTLAVVSNVVASGGLASVDAVDAKISTNNAAFVSAVLAVPLTGADAGDLAEIAEYGGYGTVGAALLALIAGLAALKRRMATAETAVSENATAVASVRADLPYALVTPGEWTFSDGVARSINLTDYGDFWAYELDYTNISIQRFDSASSALNALSLTFEDTSITATRASPPGHLLDRAGNRVVVSGDTTLTLPALVNAGRLRDFLVRLEISGSTVPTITFAAPTGETITYETDGDEFPVPDEAGDWLYSFTESCVSHKFAVSLKRVNTVAQGGS